MQTINELEGGIAGSDFVGHLVGIQDYMKMFIPIRSFLVDQFGKEHSNDFVCSFCLVVSLWIIGHGRPMFE